MKGNIKKLAVLVIVPVIALLIMVVMASAGPAIPHGIKGQFAATGISICSTDPGGFTDNGGVLIPNDPTEVSIGTSTWDAGFT